MIVAEGTYICSASIVIDRDSVTLRGTGAGTLLRLGNHVNRPVLVLGETIEPPQLHRAIHVADLAIDGNRANQDFECSFGACSPEDFLRNNGISLRRVEDVLVENISVREARSGGLVTERGSRRITVRDFTSSNNEFDGLAGYETEDSLFTDLYLRNNTSAGLSFDRGFKQNAISNAVLEGNGDVGVFLLDVHDNVFDGVRINDSGSHGMFLSVPEGGGPLTCASGNTFADMVIARSGQNPARGGFGMEVPNADCVNNMVVSTQFVGNRQGAIHDPGSVVKRFAIIER